MSDTPIRWKYSLLNRDKEFVLVAPYRILRAKFPSTPHKTGTWPIRFLSWGRLTVVGFISTQGLWGLGQRCVWAIWLTGNISLARRTKTKWNPKIRENSHCWCYFVMGKKTKILPSQVYPSSVNRYPPGQEQLYPPSMFWQIWLHRWRGLAGSHSLMSEKKMLNLSISHLKS